MNLGISQPTTIVSLNGLDELEYVRDEGPSSGSRP